MLHFLDILIIMISHIPGIVLRLVPFYPKMSRKQKIQVIICYIVLFLVQLILLPVFSGLLNPKNAVYPLIMFLSGFSFAIINMIFVKGYFKQHIYVISIVSMFATCVRSGSNFIGRMLFSIANIHGFIKFQNLFYLLISVIFLIPIIKYIKKNYSILFDGNHKEYFNNIAYFPMIIFFAMFFNIVSNPFANDLVSFLSRMLVLCSCSLVIKKVVIDFESYRKTTELKRTLIFQSQQMELQKKYYSSLVENIGETRKIKHDLKHLKNALISYIDNDNNTGLKELVQEMDDKFIIPDDIIITGNNVVDSVIYKIEQQAKSKNINFDIACEMPEKTSISDIDLCILIGNSLDNCVEACSHVDGNKFIIFRTKVDSEYLIITIENSFDGTILKNDEDGVLSRKRDNQQGIGLQSIKEICNKYQGFYEYTFEDKIFKSICMLRIA